MFYRLYHQCLKILYIHKRVKSSEKSFHSTYLLSLFITVHVILKMIKYKANYKYHTLFYIFRCLRDTDMSYTQFDGFTIGIYLENHLVTLNKEILR